LAQLSAGLLVPVGLPPLSALALRTRRSAPPVVTALDTGLGRTPTAPRPRPHAHPRPARHTPPAAVVAAGPPRGLALLRASAPVRTRATPPTRPASRGQVTPARQRARGVRLDAGECQVWDLPATGAGGSWRLTGDGAARLTFLDRAGAVLLDIEAAGGDHSPTAAPPAAARVAVSSLGRLPASAAPTPGPGAVALAAAPAGARAVVGWQAGSLLTQVGPAALLARGASVHLGTALHTRRDGRRTDQALVPAYTAVAGQPSVQTALPASVGLVAVTVDGADLPIVTATGAGLVGPTVIHAGRQTHLLYEVSERTAARLTVTVGGRSLAGVLGLPGPLADWLPTLSGAGPRHLVPDGPLRHTGHVTVHYDAPPAESPRAVAAPRTGHHRPDKDAPEADS
jgi:hypothetical protein